MTRHGSDSASDLAVFPVGRAMHPLDIPESASDDPGGMQRRQCPLLGVKQTSAFDRVMSAFDPKRTSAIRPDRLCKAQARQPAPKFKWVARDAPRNCRILMRRMPLDAYRRLRCRWRSDYFGPVGRDMAVCAPEALKTIRVATSSFS
jgi:hypothetical protein